MSPRDPDRRSEIKWAPYPHSPQLAAIRSAADILGFGGSAGGGKSDLLLGTALLNHRRATIFRREYTQLKDLIDRSSELVDSGRFNRNVNRWSLAGGRTVEFAAVQYEDDVRKFKGRPRDYLGIDEATEFTESQFRYLLGWLRTTIRGQRCRAILTFNPPTNREGQWVVRFFAPWLDRRHPNPAVPGELRWYARVNGVEVERPDGSEFSVPRPDGTFELVRPMSRTFIPARLTDNPALMATDYGRVLQNLPEPLRSQLLYGSFDVGEETDPWQLIPTDWVLDAQRRWSEWARGGFSGLPMQSAIGVDVAHGGKDRTVLAIRHGSIWKTILFYPGSETPDGMSAARLVARVLDSSSGSYACVDAIGYGSSCAERLVDGPPTGFGLRAIPVNVAARSEFRDRSRRFRCVNIRAEAYWRLREILDPESGSMAALPDSPELLQELTEPKYEIVPAGIRIEDKEEVSARLGRSPDLADAVALSLLPGPARTATARTAGTGYRPLG